MSCICSFSEVKIVIYLRVISTSIPLIIRQMLVLSCTGIKEKFISRHLQSMYCNWAGRICHSDVFQLSFLLQNTVKLFFLVVRQPCSQSFLSFSLEWKDVLGTRLIVMEWCGKRYIRDTLQWRLVDVWKIFFWPLR